jgi:hypothetical protein
MRPSVTLFTLATLAAPAFAGGSQDSNAAPAANAPTANAIDQVTADEPAADRSYLGSTALTLPAGDATWTLRQPVGVIGMANLEYGATSRIQLGAGVGWIDDLRDYEQGLAPFLTVKARALSTGWGALAIEAGLIRAPGDGSIIDGGWAPQVSAIATACGGSRCELMVSGYLSAMRTPHGSNGKELIPIYGGGSIMGGQGHVKAFLEVNAVEDYLGGGLATAVVGGARLVWPRVAVDLGIGRIHIGPAYDTGETLGSTVVLGVTLR